MIHEKNRPERRFIHRRANSLLVCGLALLAPVVVRAEEPAALKYNRDIRPILAENCFQCHGPDSASRKADLRLDKREAAVEAGAIVPGDLDSSELVFRIEEMDPSVHMPPPETKKTLTPEQKERLKAWIAAGAEYQPHWSLIAPTRPEPPAVQNESWVRNPIDQFILARLEKEGLSPAPEADRRTLARRLSLDLTGLPPEPADVDAFVNDMAPDAYEQFVERLLASPHYGEHRARYWLDAARYADTHGIHFDNFREVWAYRDWVINAFNRNQPFDQFTVEQLAGDLLPNPTLDQQIATGFSRCNITTNEGGTIPEEYLVLYTRDRTETVSQVWLGLTAGCAVCHDHKFDPLSQREFYELSAFFNNTSQNAMDGNIKDTPPILFVPTLEDRDRYDHLKQELADTRQAIEQRKPAARSAFETWLAGAKPETLSAEVPGDALRLHATLGPRDLNATPVANNGSVLELAEEGDFEKDQSFSYGAWLKLTTPVTGAVVARMDDGHGYRGWDLWVENGKIGSHIVSTWQDDALKVVSNEAVKPNEWTHVFVTYDGSSKASGVKVYINGVAQATSSQADHLVGSIRTEVPLKVGQRHNTSLLTDAVIHDLRLYGRALSPEEVSSLAGGTHATWLVGLPPEQRPEAETNALFAWWLANRDEPSKSLQGKLAALDQEEAAIKTRGTFAHVMHEKAEPASAYVLFRGDYDKRRDQVFADTPEALPPMPSDLPKNRLGFALWLVRPENPLMARVTVNRFWQELFGTGIVRTAGDFGVTGELPTHPELLDWMAVEFREGGWDVKDFYRLLVNSSTYRQASVITPQKREKDSENRLLSRGPRFRMDAEMIRDYALSVSDELVEKVGGPSVKPYQPEGVWEAVAMPESNTRNYKQDEGTKLYRRSFYTFWKRAAPPASMDIFNAPSREVCTVRRERTDTPLQALVTLNDPQFVEAARNLATIALTDGGENDESGLGLIASRLLSRPFRPEELEVIQESLRELLAYYQSHAEDASKLINVGESKVNQSLDPSTLAAWTMLTNELMNLDEVLNK